MLIPSHDAGKTALAPKRLHIFFAPFQWVESSARTILLHNCQQSVFSGSIFCIVHIPGNTWTAEILYSLLNGCKAGRERTEDMREIFLFVEAHGADKGKPSKLERVKHQTSPRKIKTHLKVDFFKRFLQNQDSCPQIIVVMRDIKDVLASQYRHFKLLTGLKFDLSFDDFLAMHDANRVLFGNPIDYNLGWWAYKDHPHVLIVKYEDMLHDTKAVVKSLGEFINRPVDEATAIEIAEVCSFTQMKGRATRYETINIDRTSFFRKGISGDWKNHFSDEQAHNIDNMIKEKCHPQGLYV